MKFYGIVGYGISGEVVDGVWVDAITERKYYGDVVKDTRRLAVGSDFNSDLSTGNSIEIVADPYAVDNFHAIKYVEWAGALWTVTEVEQKRPRLLLRLGGVYNGPRPAGDQSSTGEREGTAASAASPPRRDSGR